MSLHGLVYLSQASSRLDSAELDLLLEKAQFKNQKLGVTGYLCRFKGRILQYIEGPEENLELLFDTIQADSRHKVLVHTSSPDFNERRFPSWSMRMISNEELSQFNIELLLENNLLYLKNNLPNQEKAKTNIWLEIDSIAKINR